MATMEKPMINHEKNNDPEDISDVAERWRKLFLGSIRDELTEAVKDIKNHNEEGNDNIIDRIESASNSFREVFDKSALFVLFGFCVISLLVGLGGGFMIGVHNGKNLNRQAFEEWWQHQPKELTSQFTQPPK